MPDGGSVLRHARADRVRRRARWDYRLGLRGNLSVFTDGRRSCLDQHAAGKLPYLQDIQLTHRRVTNNIGIINELGHDEPWFIAMSDKPGYLTTLGYTGRWDIEPMFFDFKSRGFGLEQSQLQTPDRLSRLLLMMSLAIYFAVSTEHWDAVTNPTVNEKTRRHQPKNLSRSRLSWFTRGLRRIVRLVAFALPLPPLWTSA